MDNTLNRISITPTVARQTPKTEFGSVLSSTIGGVLNAGGAIIGSLPGMPIVSSAVSAVTSLANAKSTSAAATGVVNVGSGGGGINSLAGSSGGGSFTAGSTVPSGSMARSASTGNEPAGVNDMLSSMRAEADRSMMMQMNMQTESREYNALTNILKLRHDSAKAAINNIR